MTVARDAMVEAFESVADQLKDLSALSEMLDPFRGHGDSDIKTLDKLLDIYVSARDRGNPIPGSKHRGARDHWRYRSMETLGSWCDYCHNHRMTECFERELSPLFVDRSCKKCLDEHFEKEASEQA